MSPPTDQQSIIYEVALYSNWAAFKTGANLETQLRDAIIDAFRKNEGRIGKWEIAWGPVVVQLNTSLFAINSMYVAESKDTPGTYVVGIAGTNPASLFDWIVEDGLVNVQLPWIYAPISAPGAKISLGTGVGIAILQDAAPGKDIKGTGTTLLQFLRGIKNKRGMNLVVSGHSLGGALSGTLALWLHDVRILWDPFHQVTLSAMPTAGPTAGNGDFAGYSNQELALTRFANAIDVVPHAWQASDLEKIPTLYVPYIEPNDTIYGLVAAAEKLSSKGDYTQVVDDTGWFPFDVDQKLIHPKLGTVLNFLVQLGYQHTTAYNVFFGVVSEESMMWAAQWQAAALAQAPRLTAALAGAAQEVTAPVAGRPTVIPSADDPAAAAVAARVLAQLARHATPEQRQQLVMPFDPDMIGTPAEAGNS